MTDLDKSNANELTQLYQDKTQTYFGQNRPEMLKYIPEQASLILDVGCGAGNFGALLKSERGVEVWGIELSEQAAALAQTKLDKVICDKFNENLNLPNHSFDCIVFNDVLEHLVDPYSVLLYAKQLLKKEGVIVASIPNVRFIHNLYNLLVRQDWKYEDAGILDKTHLRFFTKKSIIAMFANAGYEIASIEGINGFDIFYPLNVKKRRKYVFNTLFDFCNFLLNNRIEDIRWLQFAIVARSKI